MTSYRIYEWGQRVDVYDDQGYVRSLTVETVAIVGGKPGKLDYLRQRAAEGDVFWQNWLVCRDELIDRGLIEG